MKKRKWAKAAIAVIVSMAVLLPYSVFGDSGDGTSSGNHELTKYTEGITKDRLTAKFKTYEDLADSGEGTDQISEIHTADDLKAFAASVNTGKNYYKGLTVNLNADIRWDGSERWTSLEKFSGTFKGNGHTISGLGDSFITYIDKDGSVRNLTIKGDISKDGNVGGIADISQGTITDCTYSGTIKSEDLYNRETTGCGGIAGINTGKIEDCRTAEGSVLNRTGYLVGGIAGLNVTMDTERSDAGISRCINDAEVNCFAGSGHSLVGAAGGIAGVHSVEVSLPKDVALLGTQIRDCENRGAVSSEGAAAAGIVGIAVDGKIEGCSNSGTISQTKSGLWAAGIVASMDQHKDYKRLDDTSDLIYVKECRNSGQVTGITRVAGIVGGDEPIYAYVGCIESCINTGSIQSNGYTGGISGYNKGVIRKSFNTGDVTTELRGVSKDHGDGWNAAGGIAALTAADIQNCINIGTAAAYVDEPLSYSAITGGITGKFAGGTITNSYSSAPVTGNHTNSKADGKYTVYYGGIAGERTSGISLQGCVFNDSLDNNKARRAIASDLGSGKGLDLSEMTGKNPAAQIKSLVGSGAYEYADDLTVDGTRYRLTPYLKGLTTLYAADPETVLKHAAYAVPAEDVPGDTEPSGDKEKPGSDQNDNSGSAQKVDTGDSFPFAWLALALLLSAVAGTGAVLIKRRQ